MKLQRMFWTMTAAALAAVALGAAPCSLAQVEVQAAPTAAVPDAIADPLLRQIVPAVQSRNGVVEAGWWGRHQRDLADLAAQSAKGPVHLLFVGDSITDNYHKSEPAPDQVFKPTWDEFFAPHGALNIGVSGDSTQHVLWRLQHGEVDGLAPEDIVLMIGTNNTWHDPAASAADVAEGIKAVVYELHARMPKAKILVLGILPSTVSEEKSAKDAEINRMIVAEFDAKKQGMAWVKTLDVGYLFRKPDGTVDLSMFCDPKLMPTGRPAVHPNTVGQRKMAEAVAEALYGSTGK